MINLGLYPNAVKGWICLALFVCIPPHFIFHYLFMSKQVMLCIVLGFLISVFFALKGHSTPK